MLNEEDTLRKAQFDLALQENPYDEATRRIYADWLSDKGLDDEATFQYQWTKEKQSAAEAFIGSVAEHLDYEGKVTNEYILQMAKKKLVDPEYVWKTYDYHDLSNLDSDMTRFWESVYFLMGKLSSINHGRPFKGCCDVMDYVDDYDTMYDEEAEM